MFSEWAVFVLLEEKFTNKGLKDADGSGKVGRAG